MVKADMNAQMLELVAQRFRTLGEPFRLRLLQELQKGELAVGELVAAVNGNQPNVSRHLQVLYEAGLVGRRREGTSVLYAISDPVVFALCEMVCHREADRSRREFEALAGAGVLRSE